MEKYMEEISDVSIEMGRTRVFYFRFSLFRACYVSASKTMDYNKRRFWSLRAWLQTRQL